MTTQKTHRSELLRGQSMSSNSATFGFTYDLVLNLTDFLTLDYKLDAKVALSQVRYYAVVCVQ